MNAGAGGSAFDAAVVVDEDRAHKKAVAAVAYYERELGDALESVDRLRGKAERLREQAGAAEVAYADAVAGVQVARDRYEAAKAEVA